MEITADTTTNIPVELINRNKWVLWKLETRNGKQTKIPYQINGSMAKVTDPSTWTSYSNAVSVFNNGKYSGIGYVITSDDPYTVMDLDDCIVDGNIKPDAKTLVDTLDSYTEISQSGNGLHIFIKGKKPGKRSKNTEKGIELYDDKRFIVMTGNHLEGTSTEIHDRQMVLDYIYDSYFPDSNKNEQQKADLNKELKHSPDMEDNEILNIAFKASNGEYIKRLYNGDVSLHNYDDSAADQALCNYLAFYTQKPEQIDRIFRSSGLYRDKWDSKRGNTTYGMMTINEAIGKLNNTYQKFQLHVREEIKKGSWWYAEEGKKPTFLHDRMAKYVLQENRIVRFPEEDGDIYIYNEKSGIYEVDKTCRQLRAIIRNLEFMKRNQVREVQEYIIDMSPVFREESKEYVAVKNGLLHLETMEFKEFTPDVFVTKKIPTKYKPNAYDPFVVNTLQKVTNGHKPTIKNICEMFGAVLYPTLLVPKMFYLYGRSAHNGKSTILYMIQKTFNDGNNISAISPQRLATNDFAGSSIYGKLANIVDDQPDQLIEDSGSLKTMITGGYVEIEQKNKDSKTVQMNTVFITASNHYPNFKEHGNQINKRLHILPFDYNFLEDPEVISERESMERLETDSAREYVLKLAVISVKEMIQRTGDVLTYNEKAEEAKENFSEHSDPLSDFFFEYDKQYFEERKGTDTYAEYQDWCKETGNPYPLGYDRFKDAVCRRYDMEWKDKKIQKNGRWHTVKGFKSKK